MLELSIGLIGWLIISFPFAVLVGKFIHYGMGEHERERELDEKMRAELDQRRDREQPDLRLVECKHNKRDDVKGSR